MNEELKTFLNDLIEEDKVAWWCLVGSRVTCSPPPMDTDQDILVLGKFTDFEEASVTELLQEDDWVEGGSKDDNWNISEFSSWKKTIASPDGEATEYNIIATYNPKWAEVFLDATMDCKKMNWLTKQSRIDTFKAHFDQYEQEKKELKTKTANMLASAKYYQFGWPSPTNSVLSQGVYYNDPMVPTTTGSW